MLARMTSLLLVLLIVLSVRADDMRSELPADTKAAATRSANEYRVLFVGNSITRHGTNAEIKERLKWDHVAGMAATSEDKDYAHLLMVKIQETMPDRKVVPQFSGLAPGGKGEPEERAGALANGIKTSRPDLVIFQHGEHEQERFGADKAEKTYRLVLAIFEAMQPRPAIICVGNWSPGGGDQYAGWNRTLCDTFARVCMEKKIPFVSVEKIALDPACRGWGEHPGVKWHPNDEGMRRYAEEIFATWKDDLTGQRVGR